MIKNKQNGVYEPTTFMALGKDVTTQPESFTFYFVVRNKNRIKKSLFIKGSGAWMGSNHEKTKV